MSIAWQIDGRWGKERKTVKKSLFFHVRSGWQLRAKQRTMMPAQDAQRSVKNGIEGQERQENPRVVKQRQAVTSSDKR